MSLNDLIDKKLILFCGKGGVGKTTCASAASIFFANSGKKTSIFSTDPAHSLSDCLSPKIGDKIMEVGEVENLYAIEINAEKAMQEFKEKYRVEIRGIFETASGIKYMGEDVIEEAFSLPIPGADEIISLKVMMDLMEKEEYERYVIDTAPTGHTLRLISMPDLLKKWIQFAHRLGAEERYMAKRFSGGKYVSKTDNFISIMEKTNEKLKKLLTDNKRTEFVVVTIPTSLAISETERLVKNFTGYGIPLNHIIINNIFPSSEESDFAKDRRNEEQHYIKKIYNVFSNFKIIEIPLQPYEVKGIEKLSMFNKMLFM
ncbi:MAG: ArsA family ATPase [Candidatus Omnitrophica bacterium]|nr:ArsA family ATPase [Candidatus Omnitrophota bacterium]